MTHRPIGNPPARPRATLAALFALVLLACAHPAAAEVKVEKKAPTVEHKTFDPANRPKEMPELHGNELAVTTSQYDCVMGVSTKATERMLPNNHALVAYRVRRVTVALSLKITVWLPENANDRLKDHEEGHREIAERAYAKADDLAQGRQPHRRPPGLRGCRESG